MTFNWPDIPFSGTEVDAFVVEYKIVAEEIIDKFAVEVEKLAVPYRNPAALEKFLQYGLIYAAFIVKQRAGNTGPGTDFVLGNSPFGNTEAMNTREKRIALVKYFGCSFDPIDMMLAWQRNKEKDPTLDPRDELSGPDSSWKAPISDLINDYNDEEYYGTDCGKYQARYNQTQGTQVEGQSPLWSAILATLRAIAQGLGTVTLYQESFETAKLGIDFLRYYLKGTGGVWTYGTQVEPSYYLSYGQIRNELQRYFDRRKGTSSSSGALVTEQEKAENWKSYFNVSETDKVYQVRFEQNFFLAVTFGTATVVTDSQDNIKRIIDDYDFFYSWELVRSGTGIDVPGTPYNDLQITSGTKRKIGDTCIPNVTVCQAIGEENPINYAYRFPVAAAVGNGCYENYEDHPDPGASGKPFAININFE